MGRWRDVYSERRGITWEWQLTNRDRPKGLPDWYRCGFDNIPGAQPSVVYRNGRFFNATYKEWEVTLSEIPADGYLIDDGNWGFHGVPSNTLSPGASCVEAMPEGQ